ncbi:unnamed protein product [Brachionus calyciflorus]|uniref:Uncharacterized protein n=1 Tax=Brachionus calyciflorus TaxID=104777 RepID=A0A814KAR0_9BILA|nr:unnamed protein product [Brachionus calyciflorus]
MESILDSKSFLHNRINSFKGTGFDKMRSKCSSKRMAEAGFYSMQADSDLVKCFACGVEIQNWSKSSDDPWLQHEKQSPECLYLKVKKSYSNELTVKEFIEIEKFRCLQMNDRYFQQKSKTIKDMLDLVQNLTSDQEIVTTIDENNQVHIEVKTK